MLKNIKTIIVASILVMALFSCKVERTREISTSEVEQPSADSVIATTPAKAEWLTDYKEALALAAETQKPIMVNFTGSDWCVWCIRLDEEVFSQSAFQDYAKENLILLKLDFPRDKQMPPQERAQNETLRQQYEIRGYPTIVFLNKDGKEIAARTGYQEGGAEAYVKHLQDLLKQ